jgi:hypothetical protein
VDLDPACLFDADADPDPTFHFDTDSDSNFQLDADPCGSGSTTLAKSSYSIGMCDHGYGTYSFSLQWWANLDQASKHLEVFRFRDLSPTPIP